MTLKLVSLCAVCAALQTHSATAQPVLSDQQQKLCDIVSGISTAENAYSSNLQNLNPIQRAQAGSQPDFQGIAAAKIVDLIGASGTIKDWHVHLIGYGVRQNVTGQIVTAGMSFMCGSERVSLVMMPMENYQAAFMPFIKANFAVTPLTSKVAQEFSSLHPPVDAIVSGKFAFSRKMGGLQKAFVSESFLAATTSFFVDVSSISIQG